MVCVHARTHTHTHTHTPRSEEPNQLGLSCAKLRTSINSIVIVDLFRFWLKDLQPVARLWSGSILGVVCWWYVLSQCRVTVMFACLLAGIPESSAPNLETRGSFEGY